MEQSTEVQLRPVAGQLVLTWIQKAPAKEQMSNDKLQQKQSNKEWKQKETIIKGSDFCGKIK